MEFPLFTKLPLEIQREILTTNVEILKQAQSLSKEIRELTKRDASKYKCKIKITWKELDRYLENNPDAIGLYIIDMNTERIIFCAITFIKVGPESNKYKWIQKNIRLVTKDNTIEIIISKDTDVIIEKGILECGEAKSSITESYKNGGISDIDLKTKYELLLRRGCEKEDAKETILQELEKEHDGVDVNDINYESLNLFAYLMHNYAIFDQSLSIGKDLSVQEIIANSEVVYQQLRERIIKL